MNICLSFSYYYSEELKDKSLFYNDEMQEMKWKEICESWNELAILTGKLSINIILTQNICEEKYLY